jgi:putative nucleotidyltransferase with HDIG domain
LLKAVASDPFLAARICGAANSIFFNHQHRPVQSVRDALERVGVEFVQRILMEAPTSAVLAGAPEVAEYWSHCVTVSVIAQRLVEEHQTLGLEPETAALLGLIHDIGRLVELHYSTLRLREVARALRAREIDPGDNGHAKVAASLARSWSLPPLFQDVLRGHHQPSLCSSHWSRVCASVVFVADLVALGLRLETDTASAALSYLGLSSKQCQPLYDCSVQVEQRLWHAAQSPDLQRHSLTNL